MMKSFIILFIFTISCHLCLGALSWKKIKTTNSYSPRGETSLTKCGTNEICMLGGRGTQSLVNVLNTQTLTWREGKSFPLEMHHFQAFQGPDNCAWVVGAWTGKFPAEDTVPDMMKYCPDTDQWTKIGSIARPRGAAGAVYYEGKVYLISGNVGGHNSGAELKAWFDCYDPETEKWTELDDIPHPRDHFHAAVINGKLYVAGGRDSTSEIPQLFQDVDANVDVYDFASGKWSSIDDFPRPRGGTAAAVYDNTVFILGGEGEGRAWTEVDRLEGTKFVPGPSMSDPRHGTGVVSCNGAMWIAGGARVQGGGSNSDETYAYFDGDTPPVCTGKSSSSENTESAAVGTDDSNDSKESSNGTKKPPIVTPTPVITPPVEGKDESVDESAVTPVDEPEDEPEGESEGEAIGEPVITPSPEPVLSPESGTVAPAIEPPTMELPTESSGSEPPASNSNTDIVTDTNEPINDSSVSTPTLTPTPIANISDSPPTLTPPTSTSVSDDESMETNATPATQPPTESDVDPITTSPENSETKSDINLNSSSLVTPEPESNIVSNTPLPETLETESDINPDLPSPENLETESDINPDLPSPETLETESGININTPSTETPEIESSINAEPTPTSLPIADVESNDDDSNNNSATDSSSIGLLPTDSEPNGQENNESEDSTEPSESPDARACFSSDSIVELEDGTTKPMHAVQIGDRVKVAHPSTFSDVFFFSHHHPHIEGQFLQIKTSLSNVLTVSPSHLIYINGELKPAREINVSDRIAVSDKHVHEAQVTEIVKMTARGLHNPHTIHGDIVVNGVVASTFTESVHPRIARVLLLPFQGIYRAVGSHSSLKRMNEAVLRSLDYLVW